MAREKFYQSKVWKQTRKIVWINQRCLCDKCHRPVYIDGISDYIPKEKRLKGIVHHKIHLTESNMNDENITLNLNNLVGLCIDCHNKEHFTSNITRYDVMFDEEGNLIMKS